MAQAGARTDPYRRTLPVPRRYAPHRRHFSPCERAVRMHQYRRDLCRVQPTLFEGFNDHFAGLVFILTVDLFCGHQARAGWLRKIIGVSSAPCGEIKSGLRPDGGVARVGMHYAANLRKATVKRQMRWRVGRGLLLPSTTLPLAISTTTISSAVITSYSTPEGLITIHCRVSSIALTLPRERHQMMNGKRQFAASTSAFSCSNI